MGLFGDIIFIWLVCGLIGGYMFALYPQKVRTIVWLVYMACTPFIPFIAYRICEIVR